MPVPVGPLLSLRSWLRQKGVLRFFGRFRTDLQIEWRREYAANPVRKGPVSAGSISCDINIEDVAEYCRVRMCEGDRAIIGFLIERLRPGDTCWDIGASIGVYSVMLAKAVGPTGRVLCFEPEPRDVQKLKSNAALNSLTNIEAVNVALGSQRASATLQVTRNPGSGQHSLLNRPGTVFPASINVEVYPGDLWRQENARPVPNAVKVDVEGFEEEVLSGLSETLRDEHCRTVVCEVHFQILEDVGHKDVPAKLEKMLRAAGLETFWLDWSHLAGRKP
jgi:FkbM family methyltransferase